MLIKISDYTIAKELFDKESVIDKLKGVDIEENKYGGV